MPSGYVDSLRDRLADRGFEEQTTTALDADAVFHDRTLSLTKFGFVDTYVAVYRIGDDVARASSVSTAAFEYGLRDKIWLPRGLGGNLVVYPVLVCDDPDDLAAWVDDYQPSHWAAFEFPVVVAPERNAIWFNDDTPTWGFAYYSGFRDFARDALAPR
jgi:hypothetical protein